MPWKSSQRRKDHQLVRSISCLNFEAPCKYDVADNYMHQTGYRPFVEACIDADEKGEALKYIPKLSDPREKAEVLTSLCLCVFLLSAYHHSKTLETWYKTTSDFNRLMLELAWQRKLLMLLLKQKTGSCLVD